ncbi:MAG: hypothetical protein U9O49_00240, partial [Candidatus Thermoplasmatota archaeon]|nr:hypothetical protein [Candidatus Thermoplasmatota archaeon]
LLLIVLIVLILSLCCISSAVVIPQKKELLDIAKSELDSVKSELNGTKEHLEQNLSELQELQQGDKYTLHDPLYGEVVAFIENDTSTDASNEISNAKSKGLRCALAEVIMGKELNMYQLIAFDTVDNGTVYFEINTDYRVMPEIGKNYINCVEGHPYTINRLFNDTIADILLIC